MLPSSILNAAEMTQARSPENLRAWVISGPSGAKTSFVEKDGYDESRRMEVVLKEGGVFMTGPITTSGRRGAPDRIVRISSRVACCRLGR